MDFTKFRQFLFQKISILWQRTETFNIFVGALHALAADLPKDTLGQCVSSISPIVFLQIKAITLFALIISFRVVHINIQGLKFFHFLPKLYYLQNHKNVKTLTTAKKCKRRFVITPNP
jgi:hypothetical protein